jgi:hypothetical protein
LTLSLTWILGVSPPGSGANATVYLSNSADDPTSLLEVTGLTVGGESFSLFNAPALPITIPGDTSSVAITVRFSPTSPDSATGILTVTASNAVNSPYDVSLQGETCEEENALPGLFIVKFAFDPSCLRKAVT